MSCAVHGRIVRARKVEDRRIREYVRPQFKGVGVGEDVWWLGAELGCLLD